MKIEKKHIITIIVAMISTTLTYAINYYLNLGPLNNYKSAGPVFAYGVVGIISALFFRTYAVTGLIGSFVGMSSLKVIPAIEYTLLFGFVCGVICILFASHYVGFGGKAGTTAFLSVTTTTYLLVAGSVFGFNSSWSILDYFKNLAPVDPAFVVAAIIAGIAGTMATILLREKILQKTFKTNEVVLAPSLVGLIGAIIVPWIPPSAITAGLPIIIASGTFAGMASCTCLTNTSHFLLAGILVGIINVTTATVFMGFGGALGFKALISIIIVRYALRAF